MGGRWFHGDEEMEMAVREWLRLQEPDFYMYRVFKTFAEMGAKYIDVLVDYTDMLTLYWNKQAVFNAVMTSFNSYVART